MFMGDDGKIWLVDNYLNKTLANLKENPKAAFYIFPKIDIKKMNIHSDEKMALDLLKQQKILVTAGTGFNWAEPDHFRIVFLPDLITLQEAGRRLEKFFGNYHQ